MAFEQSLKKALSEEQLDLSDLINLIYVSSAEEEESLFAAAREIRTRYFQDEVFLYGFIYLSTYCHNNCHFCSFRVKSQEAIRYRKTEEEILAAAADLSAQGVHLLDLTMGEDPQILTPQGLDWLAGLIRTISDAHNRPIMISPGVISKNDLAKLYEAGASWYACYQETHNEELFRKLRPNQDYQRRWLAKIEAAEVGYLVEDGLLCGVGESPEQLAASVLGMSKTNALAQVRAMGFVPPSDSLCPAPAPGFSAHRELIMIAVLRLLMPKRLIPASLDVDGLAGLKSRLHSGANVVTSIIPAGMGLAGVAQATLDIDNAKRTVEGVKADLIGTGLKIAGPEKYKIWMNNFN